MRQIKHILIAKEIKVDKKNLLKFFFFVSRINSQKREKLGEFTFLIYNLVFLYFEKLISQKSTSYVQYFN